MSNEDIDRHNRRETFRLDDTVTLTVRVLDEASLNAITEDFSAFRFRYCMQSHIQNQKEVRRPKLIRIKKRDPDIAEYLESLEAQIVQLAERLDEASNVSGDVIEIAGRASLSASGIRFRTTLPIKEGQVMEIGMVLSTNNTQVVMLGDVLRVESRSDGGFAVSIYFSHIHQEDTEAIVRHLARLQQLELQARRGVG